MKKKDVCPACGAEVWRETVNDSYATAQDLGRPTGAKGMDLCHLETHCPKCGRIARSQEIEVAEWFDGLDGQEVDGLTVVRGRIIDTHGNDLFGLPRQEPENWKNWVRATVQEWLEGRE